MFFLFAIFFPTLFLCSFLFPFLRRFLLPLTPLTAVPALRLSLFSPIGPPVAIDGFMLQTLLGVDAAAKVFLFFTSLLWLISGIYALGYLKKGQLSFFIFYALAMTGNIGLILAQDLVSFYLFFAWMGFASYGLVVYSGTREARYAGKVYITLVVVGELLIFLSFIMAANGSDSLAFTQASAQIASSPLSGTIFFLAFFGFGIKAGALPLHVWLPLAHPEAPTPASAVLSACMIKAGLLGWLRLLPFGYSGFSDWGYLMIGLGLLAAFYAVIVGLTQKNPKAILAYSSISQMGIMTMIAGAAFTSFQMWPALFIVLMIYASFHAFIKAALFLSVGTAGMRLSTSAARLWHRLALVLPALAIAGAPFTFGFIAKMWVKKHALPAMQATTEITFLLDASSIATGLLMARFLLFSWPQKSDEKAFNAPMYFSWTAVVILILFSPLLSLYPEIAEVVGGYSFIPYKPYELIPIFVAALVAFMAIRYRWKTPVLIPRGDLLVLYVPMLTACESAIFLLIAFIEAAKDHLYRLLRVTDSKKLPFARLYQAIENWPFMGCAFLFLLIGFFLIQIFSGSLHTPQIATKEPPRSKWSQEIRS